jgi:hypothetical protein
MIVYLPNLIFMLAKHRSGKPLSTVIHAPKTDANLRRVVLPNPDFVYSACFYDVGKTDLIITGTFPDTTQYCSLSFYGSDVQPYHVINNLQDIAHSYNFRLSNSQNADGAIQSVSRQSVILMRILATDSAQIERALKCQKTFRVIAKPSV